MMFCSFHTILISFIVIDIICEQPSMAAVCDVFIGTENVFIFIRLPFNFLKFFLNFY